MREDRQKMADKESEKTNAAVINTSKAIKQLLDNIVAWENYWRIIKSKNLLARFNRKWRALAIAQKLRYALIQNSMEFEQEKIKVIAAIQKDNTRLANELRKFAPAPETAIPNLGRLLAALNTNAKFAESFIKTHAEELIVWINSLGSIEEQDELRRLVIDISGAEISELNKCIADLESWESLLVGNNTQFFSNRVQSYLMGGVSEGREFLGLAGHYKDKNLIAPIRESDELRMLVTYQKQLEWFERARKTVAYSIYNPGWEGFRGKNGFHFNLKKGKNYINMIREKFGNWEIAAYLQKIYDEGSAGEVPKLWLPHIDEVITKIRNRTYMNANVIVPARNSLLQIFSKRKEELAAVDIKAKLEELGIVLRKIFKKAVAKSKNVARFDYLMGREKRQLEKDTNAEKREFINVLLDHGEAVIDFANDHHDQIEEQDKDITYYIGAYVYLTRAKLKNLANKLRRVPIFETVEKMREIEEKEEVIGRYAAKQLEKAAREAEKSQLILSEMIKHAEFVDKQLTSVALNYYPRNGKTILEPAYLA